MFGWIDAATFFSCRRLRYSFLTSCELWIGLAVGKILSRKNLRVKYSEIGLSAGLRVLPGIDSRKIVGGDLAHVASLRFLKSSVKVVRHRNGEFFCGRLWKKGGLERPQEAPSVPAFPWRALSIPDQLELEPLSAHASQGLTMTVWAFLDIATVSVVLPRDDSTVRAWEIWPC
jgi:hypothetical protein